MIPAPFNYEVPATLEEAVSLLAADPDNARVLAGGHSLIPAMKLRLAQPQMLVDIARIKSLSYIRRGPISRRIGVRDTAANRSFVAYLHVANALRARGQQRADPLQQFR